jgi:hypothetical protein
MTEPAPQPGPTPADPVPADPGPAGRLAAWLGRPSSLRLRYAALGAVMAILWVGRSNEPAWEHAVRTVLVLLTIRPLMRVTLRYRLRQARATGNTSTYLKWLIAVRLATVGAALGAGWLISYLLDPAHRHGGARALLLRLVLLALTIPVQIYLERRARTRGRTAPGRPVWGRFVTAKIALVLAALGAEVLLQRWLAGNADLVVTAGLFLTVTLAGPWVHRHYLVRDPKPRGRRSPDQEPASART